jgi:hypothetical protein
MNCGINNMKYILAECWNHHAWKATVVDFSKHEYGYYTNISPASCSICGNKCYSFVLEVNDPSFTTSTYNVRTFASLKNPNIQTIKNYTKDEILHVLDREGFVISKIGESCPTKIYFENANKQTAMFESWSYKKIGKLFLATPENDPILKKVKAACKLENQKIIKVFKHKPKITSMTDIIGTDLHIGDWVAFAKHKTMLVGKIIKFNEKTLGLKDKAGKTYSAYSNQSALLNEQQLLVYLLST